MPGLVRIWPLLLLLLSCNQSNTYRHLSVTSHHGITQHAITEQIIIPPHKDALYLLIENPHINHITFSSTRNPIPVIAGDRYPFSERPLPHRIFFFPVQLSAATDTLKITLDKVGENLHYTLKILTEEERQNYIRVDDRLIGLVTGFHLICVFLTFLLALYTRSSKVMVFSLYILCALIWILNDAGLLYAHLWPDHPNWHKSSRGLFSSLSILVFGLYLSFNKNPLLAKGLSLMIKGIFLSLGIKFILAFIVASGRFPTSWVYPTMHVNAVVITVIFCYLIAYLIRNISHLKTERYEVMSILIYAAFVLSLSLREFGWSIFPGMIVHQLESLYLFPLQCLFMFIHVYKSERDRTIQAEKELTNYRIEQKQVTEKLLMEVEENEKKRIAQNIHDEIGSIFAAIKYQVFALKQKTNVPIDQQDLEPLLRLSDNGIQKQYSIIDDILIDSQQTSNFEELIRKHVRLVIGTSFVKADIIIQIEEEKWSKRCKAQVFRILSELLTNTLKHSTADHIKVSITGKDSIHFTYKDNGKGFDIQTVYTGNGLRNIRDRVHILQGEMNLISNHSGTYFNCTFHVSSI